MAANIPSLNWLRVFEAAARYESFARAAAHLNMSSAAVSQQVRALEERLGRSLFDRHAHAVTLTDAGRAYLPSVQHALITVESATEGLFGAPPAQQVFVQSVLIFAYGLLTKGLLDFAEKHPEIAVTLNTANRLFDPSREFNDLEIVFGNAQALGLDSDRLIGEQIYPVALPDIAAQIRAPEDLLHHRMIEVAPHRAGWHQVFEHLGVSPGGASFIYTDDTITAMSMARQGLGLALARAPSSDQAMQDTGLVPCLDGATIPGKEYYFLVSRDHSTLRPAAKVFREWLLDWCAREGWKPPQGAGG